MSYEQTQAGEVDQDAWQKWAEDGRKLQVELFTVIDAVATEDDLDFVDKQIEAEAAAAASAAVGR
jgi:chromosome condensin MukBEF complex kleisin-like MukF subunit